MNEIQLLRAQLATERRHVREVASACAAAHLGGAGAPQGAALEAFGAACTEYLGCVLDWLDRRDQRLGELYSTLPAGDAVRKALETLDPRGRGRDALAGLEAGASAREAWAALAQFVNGAWDARCGAVEQLLVANTHVADWRLFGGIDADSVYQERALYARVRTALPAGIELAAGQA